VSAFGVGHFSKPERVLAEFARIDSKRPCRTLVVGRFWQKSNKRNLL
jgi:hypothetical protein